MKRELKAFWVSLFIIIAILVLMILLKVTGYREFDFDRSDNPLPPNPVINSSLCAELEKAKEGDFVEFDSQWHVITNINFINDGDDRDYYVMLLKYGGMINIPVYYNRVDDNARISRVIRWEEGNESSLSMMSDVPIGQIKWKAAAREFFKTNKQ
ncbi:MAG: hypothetical protein AAB377_01245 [Patescibacteria group bacterium]